jgi:hypothetical protein
MKFLVGLLITAATALALLSARYTIEVSGNEAIWQLDRWTGRVRFCAPNETTCRAWSKPWWEEGSAG